MKWGTEIQTKINFLFHFFLSSLHSFHLCSFHLFIIIFGVILFGVWYKTVILCVPVATIFKKNILKLLEFGCKFKKYKLWVLRSVTFLANKKTLKRTLNQNLLWVCTVFLIAFYMGNRLAFCRAQFKMDDRISRNGKRIFFFWFLGDRFPTEFSKKNILTPFWFFFSFRRIFGLGLFTQKKSISERWISGPYFQYFARKCPTKLSHL